MGTALKLLSQHGPGAVPLDAREEEALNREDHSDYELGLLRANLERHIELPLAAPNDWQGVVIKQ